jgi:hypothetical protein
MHKNVGFMIEANGKCTGPVRSTLDCEQPCCRFLKASPAGTKAEGQVSRGKASPTRQRQRVADFSGRSRQQGCLPKAAAGLHAVQGAARVLVTLSRPKRLTIQLWFIFHPISQPLILCINFPDEPFPLVAAHHPYPLAFGHKTIKAER